jgi:hypothetical protein
MIDDISVLNIQPGEMRVDVDNRRAAPRSTQRMHPGSGASEKV